MLFSFKFGYAKDNLFLAKTYKIGAIHQKLRRYQYGINELLLDRLIKKKFKKSLYESCLYILDHLIIMHDNDYNYILSTTDRLSDKLARLIMFGNGIIYGSNIINDCF